MAGFSFSGHVEPAPILRPMLNVGCLMNIPCGSYVKGAHGESIFNGGHALITGIGGRGNTYKSTLGHYLNITILDRYASSNENVYDTEMSFGRARLKSLSRHMRNIWDKDLCKTGRVVITDSTVLSGNRWFDDIKSYCAKKVEARKEAVGTTPMLDEEGNKLKAYYPSLAMNDSFSRMNIDAVDTMLSKNSAGESGNNMEAARSAHAKNQILIQLPVLTAESNLYMTFTAHVDDEVKLDPYAPAQKKLSFLKNGLKFKYVSNQFSFLMNNLWYCFSADPLKNQTTKAAEYPRSSKDNDKDNVDLMIIVVQNLRGKYGPSGSPFELIASQSEGILVGLSEFHHLKKYDRFGIGGNLQNYYLELLPEVALSRTTIRSKIDETPALRRALEITSEICQMYNLWFDLPTVKILSPKDIYETIKAKGYDWDIILNHTRGYWVFEEDAAAEPLQFLSSMDILNMCLDEDHPDHYRPWWYDEFVKKST